MRTIDEAAGAATATGTGDAETIDRIVTGVHDMIAGFRCAGTARLVKSGVSMTHMHVMWLLDHHGAMPMSRLAELLDVSFSNATGIVDRMEERGLVERVRVPDDRRVVLVRIAANGVAAMEETEALKHDRLHAILGRLDGRQLRRVAAAIDDLRGAIVAELGTDLTAHHHVHSTSPTTEGRDPS